MASRLVRATLDSGEMCAMCSSSQLNCRLRPANGPGDIVTEDVPKGIRALLQKCEGSIRGSGEADGEQYVVYILYLSAILVPCRSLLCPKARTEGAGSGSMVDSLLGRSYAHIGQEGVIKTYIGTIEKLGLGFESYLVPCCMHSILAIPANTEYKKASYLLGVLHTAGILVNPIYIQSCDPTALLCVMWPCGEWWTAKRVLSGGHELSRRRRLAPPRRSPGRCTMAAGRENQFE